MFSFDEFKDKLKLLGFCLDFKTYGYRKEQNDTIGVSWRTGGLTGGSCWATAENPAIYGGVEGEREPDLYELDNIIKIFCPNISYKQYKCLSKIIEIDEFSVYEYYGNYTNYSVKLVSLKKLYDYLIENNLLGGKNVLNI